MGTIMIRSASVWAWQAASGVVTCLGTVGRSASASCGQEQGEAAHEPTEFGRIVY